MEGNEDYCDTSAAFSCAGFAAVVRSAPQINTDHTSNGQSIELCPFLFNDKTNQDFPQIPYSQSLSPVFKTFVPEPHHWKGPLFLELAATFLFSRLYCIPPDAQMPR